MLRAGKVRLAGRALNGPRFVAKPALGVGRRRERDYAR